MSMCNGRYWFIIYNFALQKQFPVYFMWKTQQVITIINELGNEYHGYETITSICIYVVIMDYTGSYYPNFSDNQVWVRLQPRVSRNPTGWCRCSAPTGWYSNGVPRLPVVSQWSVHRVHGPVSEAAEGLRHVQRQGSGGTKVLNTRPVGWPFQEFLTMDHIMSQLFPCAHRTRSNGGTDSMFGFFYLPPGSGVLKYGQIPPWRARGCTPKRKQKFDGLFATKSTSKPWLLVTLQKKGKLWLARFAAYLCHFDDEIFQNYHSKWETLLSYGLL